MPIPNRLPSFAAVLLAGSLTGAITPVPPRTADPLVAPGISRELATLRSSTLGNVRYEMALSLERPDTARGTIAVRFVAKRSTDVILDFRGPSFTNIEVNGAPARTELNGAHLRVPASAIHAGEN